MIQWGMEYVKQDEVDALISATKAEAIIKEAAPKAVAHKVFKFNVPGFGGVRVVSEKWARENFRPLSAEFFPCKDRE